MTQITPQKFPFIQVEQPIGTFFVCAIPAAKILPLLAIERRGLTPEERLKVQRALDTSRQKDIAEYACEPDATFPTSVTLSANSEYVHVIEHTSFRERWTFMRSQYDTLFFNCRFFQWKNGVFSVVQYDTLLLSHNWNPRRGFALIFNVSIIV
ncbi:hypothetical protein RP726_05290 [Candidatus Methylospira mobilis]|uniref:hypothetical protein n=1 Tax=Candidatus Methylospira mobilis TaxID=1808979 RepID=UPI0028EAB1CA|nr:hypothetical protein [Candidatus Methylospira mobilis]WNV05833.1 hypothetical protein RP726_05290 [Candidatus Methylospira mobilis]